MTFIEVYGTGALCIFVYMLVLWLVSLALRNSSIVDIFWGLGFVMSNWVYFALTPNGFATRKLLMGVLVTIWGLRLSGYILWRNWRKPEDFRYQKWRKEAGPKWWWFSFIKVFLQQGFLMWIISVPLLGAQISSRPNRLTVLDIAAVGLWAIGLFFEATADIQMGAFKSNPANKGEVLDRGVWRYSRHPNYFGESVQWWAYYLSAAVAGAAWTIYSPIIMTVLLLRVSGVRLLERTLKTTKPRYAEYVASTSAFIPWFPRKK